jgi:hypothetical protein
MRSIHLRVSRIGIDRIERDFVFLDVGVVQGLVIVEMPGDLDPWRQAFGKQMLVPKKASYFSSALGLMNAPK